MGKYIGHRLVARPEPGNTFWTDSTFVYVVSEEKVKDLNDLPDFMKGRVTFWGK